MTKNILLLAAIGLGLSALSAQAQMTVYQYDRNGNVTLAQSYNPDGSTSSVLRAAYDKHGNMTASQFDEEPAANPIAESEASTYSTRVSREDTRVQATPVVARAQAPVTVIEGALTPEQARRLVNGE